MSTMSQIQELVLSVKNFLEDGQALELAGITDQELVEDAHSAIQGALSDEGISAELLDTIEQDFESASTTFQVSDIRFVCQESEVKIERVEA